jgi:hypothetical protein
MKSRQELGSSSGLYKQTEFGILIWKENWEFAERLEKYLLSYGIT